MLPKTCQKTICCMCAPENVSKNSHAESRFCKKCQVEMPSVGHNSLQKVEKVLANSAGLALRFSGCFRNEARNLPVTSYWQSCLKPRRIFCGCTVIVKYLRDVYKTVSYTHLTLPTIYSV